MTAHLTWEPLDVDFSQLTLDVDANDNVYAAGSGGLDHGDGMEPGLLDKIFELQKDES